MTKCIRTKKKYIPCKSKKKEAGIITLISNKVEFKIRSITRNDTPYYFLIIRGEFFNIKRSISLGTY